MSSVDQRKLLNVERNVERKARLFRNGRNQALRIPRDFELPGDEVYIHQDGDRLIVRPVSRPSGMRELLAGWGPIPEDLPDLEEHLPPLDDPIL